MAGLQPSTPNWGTYGALVTSKTRMNCGPLCKSSTPNQKKPTLSVKTPNYLVHTRHSTIPYYLVYDVLKVTVCLDGGIWMTFKFVNRRSDPGRDDRDIGQDMVLKVPWGDTEEDEYPMPMDENERGLMAMEKDQSNCRGYVICIQCITDGSVVQQMRPLMDWANHAWYNEAQKAATVEKAKKAAPKKKKKKRSA